MTAKDSATANRSLRAEDRWCEHSTSSRRPEQTIRVLHVDDNDAQRDAVRQCLQPDARFPLATASGWDDVSRLLDPPTCDVVVCELRPFGRTELEVVDEIRRRGLRIPVVVLTSAGSESWAAEAFRRGAADYIRLGDDELKHLPERLTAVVSHVHRRYDPAGATAVHGAAEPSNLDALIESLSFVWVASLDGQLRRFTPRWATLLGYDPRELAAMPLVRLVHPDDFAATKKGICRLKAGRQIEGFETRLRCHDGSYKWFMWNAAPRLDEGVFLAIGHDVTARKDAERQLRESDQRFQLISNATDEALWDWQVQQNHFWFNEAYRKAYGVPQESTRDHFGRWLAHMHPEDRERTARALSPPTAEGAQLWTGEYRKLRVDGSYAQVYERALALFDAQGNLTRAVGSILDISQLKNAEEKLRQSEERLRLAAKATRDAIWDWDIRKNAVWRSEGFQTVFGYAPEDMRPDNQWWSERIHPDDRPRIARQVSASLKAGSLPNEMEYRFQRADGTYADVIDRAFAVYDPDGRVVRAVGSLMDVTEHRRAAELAHMQQMDLAHIARVNTMGEIATGLAHELNQPLTAIMNYAESCAHAIRSGAAGGQEQLLSWIDKIVMNTHRAGEMIRRLRGFTRKSEPRRSTIDLDELVHEVLDLLGAEIRLQHIRVHFQGGQAPYVMADRIQIQQVLVNLLRNAFDAMAANQADDREITIALAEREGETEVTVEDRGEGIGAQNLERVFNAFFTTKPNGVGIGLAISRSIIQDHGGRLWVTRNPVRGVTFHFTLPFAGR